MRRLLLLALIATVSGVVLLVGIDRHVARVASPRIHTDATEVPERPVALVLGTAKFSRGRINTYYRTRIEAAARLYHAGRVRGLLVSGDNSRREYNEPLAMKNDLVEAGVAAEHITMDHAGFRTLDSVVRAREVFGIDRLVVVTQRFHCERAIYLAQAHGIDMVGYVAAGPRGMWGAKVRAREVLARAKAWLDVNVLDKQPRFLGPREVVGLREDQQ